MSTTLHTRVCRPVTITVGGAELHATLTVPDDARALVVFAHGSGSSRNSAAIQQLAHILNDASLATLVCDLLTGEEELLDELTADLRGDVTLLSDRLRVVLDWCAAQKELRELPIGVLGAGGGADAAALVASIRPNVVRALVLRTGRIDRAWSSLPLIQAPTLLAVGEHDTPLRTAYEQAAERLVSATTRVLAIPRAGHLCEDVVAREELGEQAARWFSRHLIGPAAVADELC